MKKRVIIISIIMIIIITIAIVLIFSKSSNNKENINSVEKSQPQATSDSTQLALEDTDMEMRQKELDEKIKTILYGILNITGEVEEEYNEANVNKVVDELTIKNGIYISEKGREKILNLINNTTNCKYEVDDEGYLINTTGKSTNEISQKIDELISGNKCIILDYNIYYYCILGNDICTFNIEPTEYMEKFEGNNIILMVLNPNKYEQEYESAADLINQIINNA